MSQYLPKCDFKWVKDINENNFFNVADNSPIGYIIEVDLEIPQRLHDYFADLPLLPEHMTPPNSKQEKLLTTLFNKERYVLHYRALKQALKYGVVLRKIHRALKFRQDAWLKPYVDFNTDKRKEATNEFEKMFYKLMINAVYGKTMENERKRVDVKLVHKWYGRYSAEALIARPNFHSRSIFCEDLVAIQLTKTEIVIRKPIYVGLSVLDISKTLMYDFHYSFMKEKMGDSCKLLYTDTDSLIYDIRGFDIYEIIKENLDKFDTSDYNKNNPFAIPRMNKKVIGLFKDECNGKIMSEFIGLRSKMYCIRIHEESSNIKKAKGVKSRVVKNKIKFEDYEKCLFDKTIIKVNQNVIKSRLHVVRTEEQRKIGLSPKDDKRYLIPDSTDTLPWGHYKIPEDENLPEVENIPKVENVLEEEEEIEILLEKMEGGLFKPAEIERKIIPVIDLEEGPSPAKKNRISR